MGHNSGHHGGSQIRASRWVTSRGFMVGHNSGHHGGSQVGASALLYKAAFVHLAFRRMLGYFTSFIIHRTLTHTTGS